MEECIRMEGIGKSFDGCQRLKDLTLLAERGDVFGLLGPNGAGKTTTIRIMLGLLKPDMGDVFLFGQKRTFDQRPENLQIGFVLDRHGFYLNLKARDNLEIYGNLYGLDQRDMKQRIRVLCGLLGIEERLEDKVKTYSKGMLQKLALARSLLHKPKLLILDEPASGLDPSMQVEIRHLIKRLADEEKVTVFLSSHQLDEMERICSRIAVIADGEIKLAGDTRTLLSSRESMAEYRIASASLPLMVALLEEKTLLDINGVIRAFLNEDRLLADITDHAVVPLIYNKLLEYGIGVLKMDIRGANLEDLYFSAVGVSEDVFEKTGLY